ncbi:hypothetical protein [Altererythrobacter sp. TH136]|uniref:hypothetical protein n=2 Tax=Bacteria TaxID=2 RepID=UPI001FEF40F8|nr:hypothetical protein [Altererythrobacter sp. TH136]
MEIRIMKKFALVLAPLTFALAACGGADDASTEAQPDTVEMPADAAMTGVTAEPAVDPSANATVDAAATPAASAEATTPATAEEAGANAADVAARAQAAAAAADAATETAPQ